jgi:alpha-glucosidase
VTEADGSPGEWYLHLFAPGQPDFNWGSADVRREFEDVLRFWFARGVDGIRIDSAALLCKDAALPDVTGAEQPGPAHPYTDRDEVHAVYQSWRAIADSYGADSYGADSYGAGDHSAGQHRAGDHGQRMLIGEVWLPDDARLARYVGPGELHTVFNFPYLNCPWDAAELRRVIDETLALNAPLGVPATWVLSNHDVDRVVSRYGRPDTSFDLERRPYFHSLPVDLTLGTRRARAAALLTMALPGSVYVYQGEELGLWEVQDIPDELRQDPIWARTGGTDPGRDGCRVPLPWSGTEPPFGFSPARAATGAAAEPWLPQPKEWRELTVAAESDHGDSMLSLYRAALRIRRSAPVFATAPLSWRQAPDGVLAFDRPAVERAGEAPGLTVRCVANLSAGPVGLPAHASVLLASGPLVDGLLPPDTTAWLSVA